MAPEEPHSQPNETVSNEATQGSDPSESPATGTQSEAGGDAKVPAGWYPDPTVPGTTQQRYWDGERWTDNTTTGNAATSSLSTAKRSADERKAILAQHLQMAAARGLRVESQSDYQAVLVQGKPVNNTLHAILTIFTCLLWGIVWAIIAGTGGERREMIVVDEFGNVQVQKLGKA